MTIHHSTPAQLKKRLHEEVSKLSGLSAVEAQVREKFSSASKLLVQIPDYLFETGGKRMRPVLCLMISRLLGVNHPTSKIIDIAAGIELIHMATLLHDDIIDKSPIRRHRQSAYLRFGIPATLLSGDFLLVRAFSLCAHLDDHIIDLTEKACIELTEGEMDELFLFDESPTLSASLEVCRKKTAALFRLSAETAAYLVQGDTQVTRELASFGENLGIAFQILDDVLDITADEKVLGKKPGQDLREKKPSVLNLIWLESGSALARRFFSLPAGENEGLVEAAIEEMRSSPAITRTRHLAEDYVNKALASLEAAAALSKSIDSQALAALRSLADYTLSRLE